MAKEPTMTMRMVKTGQADEWLTASDVTKVAKVHISTIYNEVRAGRLRAAKIGGRRCFRFRPAWVDQWLENAATPQEMPAKSA